MDRIKNLPSDGLTYNPNDPKYWDPAALQHELDRAFDICQGCRLCFGLCPSFPELFRAADQHSGEVRNITTAETDRILDTCFQCRICYVKCPYTPDDGHEFQLDFPRLLIRANLVRAKQRGIPLRARILARPELAGRVGGLTASLTNWANRQPLLRLGLEKTLGIHRDKLLPEFHSESFEDWFRKQPPAAGDPSQAVLFFTCFANYNSPRVAKAAVEVYSKNGIALQCPKQNCCGMPALESGDFELAKKLASANVESLLPAVDSGKKVVAINPTCSYMLRKEYGEIVGTEAARKVSAATMDLCEYLFQRKQQGLFNREFLSSPGRVNYHLPCHLRAQNIGYRSRDLMRLIPKTTVRVIEQCSAHDGTWAMKKEFFPLSMLTGKKAFDEMAAGEPEITASDCPLAAIHFNQALGARPIHPIEVLARAYCSDGFPQRLEQHNETSETGGD
ncbi:MAG: 4Fe-4S dicluster domain-containing protein [Acidobacteria bacterium]|nr:4Fe-4S dicluster domain-containing protein [Acidobacteriota bacterium]